MTIKSLIHATIGAAMMASLALGAASTPAQAATTYNGNCESGEFCYFYNSGLKGGVADFTSSLANYGTDPRTCYKFKTTNPNPSLVAGVGKCIKNNAASVWNRSAYRVMIFYNSDYKTPDSDHFLTIAPGEKRNLKGTYLYNENASHFFIR